MNKPLLSAQPRRRISLRETALGLLALGCAAGWLNERMDNRSSEEVREFVDGLRQVRRIPGGVVEVVIYKGGFPVSCRMQRFEAAPPPAAKAAPEKPSAQKDALDRPADAASADAASADRAPIEQPEVAEPVPHESP